jgi:rhodanese-related sulfurtransferase
MDVMKELTAKEVQSLLNEGKKLSIIDVREVFEVMTGKIPGAVNIPMGQIADAVDKLDQSNEYVIVCRSGNRSAHVTMFLEAQGFNVSNMRGGMLAWNGAIE